MENDEILKIAKSKAEKWLSDAYDEKTRESVKGMLEAEDPSELIDAFYTDLTFGTGGLRGVMGAGTNRMNIYTVGAATQGFANFINKKYAGQERSVCIGHDCRINSRLFAESTAAIFSANGITAYLFNSLRPTPEMSFAIRELGCKGGVIITASHNPKEYNGYKAYGDDGSQLVPPDDKAVIDEVSHVKVTDIKFEKDASKIKELDESFDKRFLERVKSISLSPDSIKRMHDICIVFTPLHGTTYRLVPESLRYWGFTNIHTEPAQSKPDGEFPTVVSANPEEPAAFKLALELAEKVKADVVMASDPDGDRIGISVPDESGKYILLNGNQTNIIFTYYIMRRKRERGELTGKEYTIKTIVTSELLKEIAEKSGARCYDVYTGFKWIAYVVRQEGPEGFIGAGEESFGFMPGAYTRDKDSVSAISLMAEICAWAKDNGKTLYTLLKEIYAEFGFSQERMIYIVRKGITGAEEINAMMESLRTTTPDSIAGSRIIVKKDYKSLVERNLVTGEEKHLDFPVTSDVLQFFLEDGCKISVRPSGTEPKIKFYFEARAKMATVADFDRATAEGNHRIDEIIAALKLQ